jgi:hypothetical protein
MNWTHVFGVTSVNELRVGFNHNTFNETPGDPGHVGNYNAVIAIPGGQAIPGLAYLGIEFQRSYASNTLRGVHRHVAAAAIQHDARLLHRAVEQVLGVSRQILIERLDGKLRSVITHTKDFAMQRARAADETGISTLIDTYGASNPAGVFISYVGMHLIGAKAKQGAMAKRLGKL